MRRAADDAENPVDSRRAFVANAPGITHKADGMGRDECGGGLVDAIWYAHAVREAGSGDGAIKGAAASASPSPMAP